MSAAASPRSHPGIVAVAIAIAAFLVAFLVIPVVTVVWTAFSDGQGGFTFAHFSAFAGISLMRESFANSLFVAGMTVGLATLIAVPLAYLTVRFQFRGAILIQTLGVLPLVMPAFVGAAAMQLLFGRSGSVNLILKDLFGVTIPLMEGLNGVIFVETLHYFPFILLNLSASLANIDSSMEEAAQNLGSSGFRLFRKVVFPLAMPGYVAGASLVFIKVFDDLGTPLVLNVTNMLAPQAYLRVTSIGLEDPIGYVICVILVAFSVGAMGGSWWFVKRRDYALVSRGGVQAPKRILTPWQSLIAYGWIAAHALPRAVPAPGHPADVVFQGVELHGASRTVHARALFDRLHRREADDLEHLPLLRARRPHRCRHRHGDRLHRASHRDSRAPASRSPGHGGARHARPRPGHRLPAHLQGRRPALRRRRAHRELAHLRAGLRRAPAALRTCARAWPP